MATVRTNGVETYYERRGEGPPVVFVHGAVVDHHQWEPQAEALADEYTTYVYDVRGHGRTGGSDEDSYSIDLFAADLDAFCTALDIERPVLCGTSMGGCIAQVYAARHPDRVAGLVLADTFTPTLHDWRERVMRSLALRATVYPVRLLGYERTERWMVRAYERVSKGSSGDYEQVERIRERGPKMSTDEFAKVVRAVGRFHETRLDLSAISAPTLVLYGENEPGVARRHVRAFRAAIADVTVRVVPGGGHASNMDAPEFVTRELRTFLDRVVAGDAVDAAGSGST
ncbi:alpha/beta fold hydrolase [Halobium salinum]|uniref:Alpha/beta fold hydrolase n=1 Tax=Halobium salinum TaxID=1364940 RepID=A0ABD5P778_9EURY|nr:alpha/beta hydrolase [Halobium salinum]